MLFDRSICQVASVVFETEFRSIEQKYFNSKNIQQPPSYLPRNRRPPRSPVGIFRVPNTHIQRSWWASREVFRKRLISVRILRRRCSMFWLFCFVCLHDQPASQRPSDKLGDFSPPCPNADLTSSLGSHKGDAMEVSLDSIQFSLVQLFKITSQIVQIMRTEKRVFEIQGFNCHCFFSCAAGSHTSFQKLRLLRVFTSIRAH